MLTKLFTRQSLPTLKINSVYKDCSELPLYNWIKLATTGSLKWLMIEGDMPDDLQDQYGAILAEYSTLIKDARTTQELRGKIRITQLANRIDQVNIIVTQLRLGRDENMIALLRAPAPNGLGFGRLKYDDLQHDLDLTLTYLKMDEVVFKQQKAEIEKMLDKADDNGHSEADFYAEIAMLEKWRGIGINPKETTVIQYISILNSLKSEIKANGGQ